MLVRSAGRRSRRHTSRILAASFAKLQLPWLAPAQLRWASQASSSTATRRKSISNSSRPNPQLRRLATTSDQYSINYESAFAPPPYTSNNPNKDDHVPLRRPHADPVIINTTTNAPLEVFKVQHGVSGNVREMLAHLHTSLSVGRRDRAKAIIHRLNEHCGPKSAELSYAHAAYLGEFWKTLQTCPRGSSQSQAVLSEMQRWFEKVVRPDGVRLDGRILIIMIRAAIMAHTKDSSRDRAVRRYSDIAESLGPETFDNVVFSEDYTDEEFTVVGSVTSDYFEPMEEDVSEEPRSALSAEEDTALHNHREASITTVIPEVLPTTQKGDGLETIKQTLRPIVDLAELPADASDEVRRQRAYEKQQILERASVEVAVERWRKADDDLKKIGINTIMQNKPIGALMWQWYERLLPALKQELAETKAFLNQKDSGRETDRHVYGPYLESLPLEKIAANTIVLTLFKFNQGKNQETDNYDSELKLNQLTLTIAKSLEQEYLAENSMLDTRPRGDSDRFNKRAGRRQSALKRSRAKSSSAIKPSESNAIAEEERIEEQITWPLASKIKLAAMIIAKLFETAQVPVTRSHPRTGERVTQMQPAFMHRVKYLYGRRCGMVVANSALVEKIRSEPTGALIAKRMPMLVEPKPWQGWSNGGYLHYPNPVLRLPLGDKTGKDYFMAAHRKGDLEKVYRGLNALAKVPWVINKDVFNVQLEAWNTGEEIANIAPLNPEVHSPPELEPSADPEERYAWAMEVKEAVNKRDGLHSKRCFQNFQMEVARSFRNETMYFPHNLDFRGRAYPMPPYLNHMGADNVRGLVTFANGKELGSEGLRWLKIHLATVSGFDKASMEERVEFTMSHLDDIYDSVRSPLDGRRWWLQAEDAWQTLAACFELTKALDSPDPIKFVSHLPVQQDGTCNGLQHYAALGGDEAGAAQVNLEPGDRPADVYTAVAEAVKKEIRTDAAQGHPVARFLDGHITRKCVKQPVMTNVYGVTMYGARKQVRKQLEELFPNVKRTDEINHGKMSHYIVAKIFRSLGTLFKGAQAIQNWLGECADRISTCMTPEQIEEFIKSDKLPKRKTSGRPSKRVLDEKLITHEFTKSNRPFFKSTVVWTTPLGLPVVQPYRTSKSRSIATCLQNIAIQEPQVWDPVSRRKQLQAFPPNFIHSLDASHMLLSAQKCDELGLTFASIHDSFWTHACDVSTMSAVLRDAFVSMHGEDIIGRLREEFQVRYKGAMYMATIRYDSPLGQQIIACRKSLKTKGKKTQSELELEVERFKLLESEDPEERARGEAMVTPGSIAAAARGDSAFCSQAGGAGQTLGQHSASSSDMDNDDASMEADSEALADFEEDVEDSIEAAAEEAGNEDEDELANSMPKQKWSPKLHVWLPMEFPEVPEKGSFDVSRLRESKYFFH